MTKHVLLVGRARAVLAKATDLDLRYTLLLKMGSERKSEDLTPYHRVLVMPSDAKVDEWLAQARLIHGFDPFDVLGAFTETAEEHAAEIARDLGLPYHAPEVIAKTHDKQAMRAALCEAGIDDTGCRLLSTPDAAAVRAFAGEFGYPVVLKPVNARGSLGVSIARSEGEIAGAIRWFRQWANGYQLLLEQFLDGEEWSVEAFSEDGEHQIVCITQKFKDPESFVETGHCLPARLDSEGERAIEALVHATLDAVGIRMGPSHTEVIVTTNGPRVVETHARLGGDRIVDLIDLIADVNLNELWMRQVTGESVIERVPNGLTGGYAAISFVSPLARGTLERVDGVDKARAQPGVRQVDLLQKAGAQISATYDSFSRGASVIAIGATGEEAVERARTASAMLRFVISCAG